MKIITTNKKASYNYEILDKIETGIVLIGDEVKSIRAGHISINEAFATITGNKLTLINCNISPYSHAYSKSDDISRRTRTLLAHKKEIHKLIGETSRKGLTLVPLKVYFNEKGFIKVEIGIAKHKNAANKKESIKERDIQRETERYVKGRFK